MAEQLTAIIPCKNEQANIRPCIESLRGLADEILVGDSGSTLKGSAMRGPRCRVGDAGAASKGR